MRRWVSISYHYTTLTSCILALVCDICFVIRNASPMSEREKGLAGVEPLISAFNFKRLTPMPLLPAVSCMSTPPVVSCRGANPQPLISASTSVPMHSYVAVNALFKHQREKDSFLVYC